ncbi:MAG: hypothetical protein ACI83P_001668, partial [Janthinobacterium sp.]
MMSGHDDEPQRSASSSAEKTFATDADADANSDQAASTGSVISTRGNML